MEAIISFLESIINFVSTFIESILWFVVNLPGMLQILMDATSYAPSFLSSFLALSISATALFAIIRLL